jgi:hypothetical protein
VEEVAMPYSEPVLTSYGPIVSLTHSPGGNGRGKGKGRGKGNDSEED